MANPTLKSTVTSSALDKDTSVMYDTDYIPEAEGRGQALGKGQILHTSLLPLLASALYYYYGMDDSSLPPLHMLLQNGSFFNPVSTLEFSFTLYKSLKIEHFNALMYALNLI